jgi:hypothetical protein
MPACAWSVNDETAERVEFICSTCSRVIGFVKPDFGHPNPVPDGNGSWAPPDNVLDWLDPCP